MDVLHQLLSSSLMSAGHLSILEPMLVTLVLQGIDLRIGMNGKIKDSKYSNKEDLIKLLN